MLRRTRRQHVHARADLVPVLRNEFPQLLTGDTNFLREGQTVTVQGRRTNGFLDATRVEIIGQAP